MTRIAISKGTNFIIVDDGKISYFHNRYLLISSREKYKFREYENDIKRDSNPLGGINQDRLSNMMNYYNKLIAAATDKVSIVAELLDRLEAIVHNGVTQDEFDSMCTIMPMKSAR
jgi:hypothetical protein